jgi:hypothetical protein
MPKISRYPRGFAAIMDGEGFGDSVAAAKTEIIDQPSDRDIEKLYEMFITRSVDPNTWRFRREVITACCRLFGDFHRWLALQAVYNDNVYGLNFEFLKDTLQFIREGRRDMSTFTWNDLLLEFPEPQVGSANPRRIDEFGISDPKEFENVIGKWCSHSGGFEDMLCTAHVLYGVSKKPMGVPKLKFQP